MTDQEREAQIQALEDELRTHEARGNDDRADQVRAELERLGAVTLQKRAERRPRRKGETR